jgi:hypothetical protein
MSNAIVRVNPIGIAAVADKDVSFDYTFMPVGDMQVKTEEDEKTGKKKVVSVLVQDEELKPTERFWTSLYARYGFNSAFFKYFDHAEVFTRISDVEKNDRMRLCIERDIDGRGTLLGVSNPSKPIVVYDELMDLLTRYQGEGVSYHNGIVESTHTPRSGANLFQVGGDDFANRFLLATPVDGYGAPNIYLSLLRLICSNGVVGYTKAFRASLALGKGDDDVAPSLTRALDGFSNDEGYAALRQRIEASATSWASVYEATSLYKALTKALANRSILDQSGAVIDEAKNISGYLRAVGDEFVGGVEGIGSKLLVAFHRMTGDTSKLYGLANLDALSVKRQRTLPVRCTVYDLLNFATEISTHYATPSGSRLMQGWLGGLITEEYDMENTKDKFGDFADFHTEARTSVSSEIKMLAS